MQIVTFINSRGQTIELSNSLPFLLSRIDGLGDVSADIQLQKSPFQDGATYTDIVLQTKVITLEVSIVGENTNDIQSKRSLIASVFNPKLGEGLLRYENENGVREIAAVVDGIPIFPSGGENRGRTFQKTLITLVCPDPYWKSSQITEEPMAAFVELFEFPFDDYFEMGIEGHTRYFTNDSDTEVPLKITIKGPTSYPTLTNTTTGEFIRVKRTLSADDVLEISTEDGNKYVLLNGEDAFSWIDIDSVFFKLAIGENEIRYTADAGQESATLTIEWQERYNAV